MHRLLFVRLALVLALPASAQSQRRTVLDYFKMLPSKRFFEVPSNERIKWLRQGFNPHISADNRSVVDLKSDFLRFPGDGAQSKLDVAVFRFHGQDTVAVAGGYEEGYGLTFWRERNGRLREVTQEVFSFRFSKPVTFIIPRQGTTIRVLKGGWPHQPSKTVLARFLWRGGRFVRS